MQKPASFWNQPKIIFIAAAVASVLVFLCFLDFRVQVNSHIETEMRSQIEAIQTNSTQLVQNELSYLKRLTTSTAFMLSRLDIQTDEDILQALKDYAETASLARTLFVTLDGHAYTNYAGYLGQNDEDTAIDGIPLAEITEPIFSQPYYAEDLDEVVFGVVAPTTMGGKQGVLVSSYNIKDFAKLLANKFLDGAANIGIVNSKGQVINGRKPEDFMQNIFDPLSHIEFEDSSAAAMQAAFANGQPGLAIYRVDGVARYCTYAPVELNDWYVVVTVQESSLRAKLLNLEQYGLQLTVKLVVIMLALLAVIIANRVGEQKKIRLILEQAASLDGLTGIYNRKAIEELIEQVLQAAGQEARAALLIIDVDDFKQINDQQGHLFGDKVLKECANRLQAIFGETGAVGRIGGDEFVVFIRDGRNAEVIIETINELNRNFCIPTDTGEMQQISISVGLAQASPQANSFLTLYQLADAALYRAKQAGKARLSN